MKKTIIAILLAFIPIGLLAQQVVLADSITKDQLAMLLSRMFPITERIREQLVREE